MLPLLAWAAAFAVPSQAFTLLPADPLQGDAVRITARAPAEAARAGGRTVRLFEQADKSRLGLLPLGVEQPPGPLTVELLGAGGEVLAAQTLQVRNAKFPIQNVPMSAETAALRPAPDEGAVAEKFRNTVTEQRFWGERLDSPVPGCATSPFGVRRFYNGNPSGGFHGGLDLRAAKGQKVRAAAPGVVRLVRELTLHGLTVGIDHGQGLLTMYLHLSGFMVKEGDAVDTGDVIGLAGSSGRSNAPHLHWTVYANGAPVNPGQWVSIAPCPPPAPARARK
jgi:murein DD-endopeptidase MepM/ murein hydrolase activator NlpD